MPNAPGTAMPNLSLFCQESPRRRMTLQEQLKNAHPLVLREERPLAPRQEDSHAAPMDEQAPQEWDFSGTAVNEATR